MHLKILKLKLRMESSMNFSIKGLRYLSEVAKSQWGSYCIQHVLEHGSEKHRRMTLDHLLDGLLEFATNEQGSKSITKALKEGGLDTLDKVVRCMCESANGAHRAMIVDLALSVTVLSIIQSDEEGWDERQRPKTGPNDARVVWALSHLKRRSGLGRTTFYLLFCLICFSKLLLVYHRHQGYQHEDLPTMSAGLGFRAMYHYQCTSCIPSYTST